MTRPFVGVSLKMYFDHNRTVAWTREVTALARNHPALHDDRVELALLPSFPSLLTVREITRGTNVLLGAQDVAENDAGAFTGDVSAASLAQVGCQYVEIGHAERRARHGEDDALVARKLAAAWRHDLIPLLCVGERETGSAVKATETCISQLTAALGSNEACGEVVVAYEPVWAIGMAEPAPSEHVSIVARSLRTALAELPSVTTARVIYGGSAGPGLLNHLCGAVDGLFLGRFAHDPQALFSVLAELDESLGSSTSTAR
ncbi:MAG: triose-phosphate isomerase family protein [Propionibacteriaceae bacterium]